MKNKHLVLLFMAIVVLGWIGRQMNCKRGTDLQSSLSGSTRESLYKLLIISTDTVEIIRHEGQWIAGIRDENILFPDSLALPIVQAITGMESILLLKTTVPDTLGFFGKNAVQVRCYNKTIPREEIFTLGNVTSFQGQPATWVAIKGHQQYYLAKGDLKKSFQIRWDQLKTIKLFLSDTTALYQAMVIFEKDTTIYKKSKVAATDSLSGWLNHFYQLTTNAPEVDFFDVEHEDHSRTGEIHLQKDSTGETLSYFLYYAAQPTLPDDPARMKQYKNFQPQYIIVQQKNPGTYYGLADTGLVRAVMR